MRDDVKIGFLLGFLLFVGVFVFWLVRHGGDRNNELAAVDGTAVVSPAPAPTPPKPAPAAANPPPARVSPPLQVAAVADDEPVPLPRQDLSKAWAKDPAEKVAVPDAPPAEVGPGASKAAGQTGPREAGPAGKDAAPGKESAVTGGAAVGVTPAFAALEVSPEGVRLYKIQQGDTAWVLAERFYLNGTKMSLLKGANPEITNWNALVVGATIKVPTPPAAAKPGGPTEMAKDGKAVGPDEYVVQANDTLSKIAADKLGKESRWHEIEKLNPGIDPDRLHAGQTIKLPKIEKATGTEAAPAKGSSTDMPVKEKAAGEPAAKEKAAGEPAPAKAAPAAGEYVIQSGDTLTTIAGKQLGKESRWREIERLNPGIDPNRLHAGQTIKLPPKETTGGASGPTSSTPPAKSTSDRHASTGTLL